MEELKLQPKDFFHEFKNNQKNEDKKALAIMESYITEGSVMDQEFFNRFYRAYLPYYFLKINMKDIKNITDLWVGFSNFLKPDYNFRKDCINAYKNEKDELKRLLYLFTEVRKFGEIPILTFEPFLVDMRCYRNLKNKDSQSSNQMDFDRGCFILRDRIGRNLIYQKTTKQKAYYKIKLEEELIKEMEIGDILEMSMKRKTFSTTWEIVNVKAYLGAKAMDYIENLGGAL